MAKTKDPKSSTPPSAASRLTDTVRKKLTAIFDRPVSHPRSSREVPRKVRGA